jgi:hypothetical protein
MFLAATLDRILVDLRVPDDVLSPSAVETASHVPAMLVFGNNQS